MGRQHFMRFWEYTQLPAKLACILPFLLGLLYALVRYHQVSPLKSAVFFVAMLAFDLTVTGLNNFLDSKQDGTALPYSRSTAKRLLIILWLIAAAAAFGLVWLTDLVVLAAGALCVVVGIIYSFGPAPLSRMPLGEVFSGVFEGFFIPFLVVYINAPTTSLLWYDLHLPQLTVSMDIWNIFCLALLSAPAVFCIAGIMLANNICDLERDIAVRRYTLPYYIGTRYALLLHALLYIGAFADVLLLTLFGVLPPYGLIILLGLLPVWRNVRKFGALQSKKETFPLSILNFIIIMGLLILVLATAAIL